VGQKAKELSALAVSKLIAPGMHAVGGVDGLYLRISDTGARSWIVRLTVDGKRREMGLGGFPDVTLAEAREKARGARSDLRMGIDPVEQRRQARSARQALKATQRTFADCAKAYIEAHSDGWRNAKHRAQWPATFETYVYPTMGAILVSEITQAHVLEVLRPIWKAKTQTATRLRGRIEQVMSWATAAGYRQGENLRPVDRPAGPAAPGARQGFQGAAPPRPAHRPGARLSSWRCASMRAYPPRRWSSPS
jgi:hypothetical protein